MATIKARIHFGAGARPPGYRSLAEAVILLAVDDYERALLRGNQKAASELEEFFMSDWFCVLSDIDPAQIMSWVRRKAGGARKRVLGETRVGEEK